MRKIFVGIATMLLSTVAVSFDKPNPEASEYLKTTGGGAEPSSTSPGLVILGLRLDWTKSPSSDVLVVAEFENPENQHAPYVIEQHVNPSEGKFLLVSPVYACIVNYHTYQVTIRVFADSKKQQQFGLHEQKIAVAFPEKRLKELNLKVCSGNFPAAEKSLDDQFADVLGGNYSEFYVPKLGLIADSMVGLLSSVGPSAQAQQMARVFSTANETNVSVAVYGANSSNARSAIVQALGITKGELSKLSLAFSGSTSDGEVIKAAVEAKGGQFFCVSCN